MGVLDGMPEGVGDTHHLKCFASLLGTSYVGLNYLSVDPVHYEVLKHPLPFKEGLVPLKKSEKNRTYLNSQNNTVVKIFDSNERVVKANIEVMQLAGIHPSINYISLDKRFFTIMYDYIEGDHKPTTLGQFRCILKMMDNIHKEGYVHGDIRLCNLVFDKQDGYLIDYDLVGKDGLSQYPLDTIMINLSVITKQL